MALVCQVFRVQRVVFWVHGIALVIQMRQRTQQATYLKFLDGICRRVLNQHQKYDRAVIVSCGFESSRPGMTSLLSMTRRLEIFSADHQLKRRFPSQGGRWSAPLVV